MLYESSRRKPGWRFTAGVQLFIYNEKFNINLSSSTFVPGFDLNISRIWTASQVQTMSMMFPDNRRSSNYILIFREFWDCLKYWPDVTNWKPAVNRQPGFRRVDS